MSHRRSKKPRPRGARGKAASRPEAEPTAPDGGDDDAMEWVLDEDEGTPSGSGGPPQPDGDDVVEEVVPETADADADDVEEIVLEAAETEPDVEEIVLDVGDEEDVHEIVLDAPGDDGEWVIVDEGAPAEADGPVRPPLFPPRPGDEDFPAQVSDDAERAAILAEVLRDQERRMRADRIQARRTASRAARWGAGVLVVVASWLWILPPGWLEPDPPPPVPAHLQEAGLRLGIYLQAQQIEAFRKSRGRLPDVLEETGHPMPGLRYQRLSARDYRLHGITPGLTLTYLSTDSLAVFVSDAQSVVDQGRGR